MLSAHKKLVAEKLAEEEVERKVKGETKKEKHLVYLVSKILFFIFYFLKWQYVCHEFPLLLLVD